MFKGWFDLSWSAAGNVALRSIVVYFFFLLGLRLFGKREVGQFTYFDLALVLLVANALQPAMTGPDSTVGSGLVIVVVLLAGNWVVAKIRLSSPRLRHALEGSPTVIARDGHWLQDAMRDEGVDADDAMMALREHGLAKIEDCELAVLETDGSISIVPRDSASMTRSRRKLRTRRRV